MPKRSKNGQIKLILDGLRTGEGTIPVPELLERLSRLQNLVFTAGEYVLGEPFKDAGRRPTRVTQKYTLILKEIMAGSTGLVVEVSDCQGTLTETGLPFGVQAINLVGKIIGAVEMNEDPNEAVDSFIDDSIYRSKMARQLETLMPMDENGVKVSMELTDGKRRHLPYSYRPRVEKLIIGHGSGKETKVQGAITKIRFTGERSIELWTTSKRSFKCSFEPEFVEQIAGLAGKLAFVEVRGIAEMRYGGGIVGIKEISSIVEAGEMELDLITWRESNFKLKHPLRVVVDVDLAEEMWTVSNDELGIFSAGKDYDSAMNAFQ